MRGGKVSKRASRRSGVPKRKRIAHHEAGHAVLSAAIGDSPHLVSIRQEGASLGRARYRFAERTEWRVQVHLAGFAAEELLKGVRSKQYYGSDLGLSIAALTDERFRDMGEGLETSDQFLAVQDIISLGEATTRDAIAAELERFYLAAKESLSAIWPVVQSVAKALMSHTEIDDQGFRAAIGARDIYTPVFDVQERHGFLRRMTTSGGTCNL